MLDLPNAACMHRSVVTYVLGAMDAEEGRGDLRGAVRRLSQGVDGMG